MLEKVRTREESYNNRGAISKSPVLSAAKVMYYRYGQYDVRSSSS
jgi:hypothetical protein